MKRWMTLASQLYPHAWRVRYGDEFAALLEETRPTWRKVWDVAWEGVRMQLNNGRGYWRIAALAGAAGAIAALAVSFVTPGRYISSAAMELRTPPPGPGESQADVQRRASDRLILMQQNILSRGSLAEMMQRPSLDLYRNQRSRMPMEDVVEQMRKRDIQFRRTDRKMADGSTRPELSVSFAYPDQWKAQAVTRELLSKLLEQNNVVQRQQQEIWRTVWRQPPPAADDLWVEQAANFPVRSENSRLTFVLWGIAGGSLAGILLTVLRRRPRKGLQLALTAIAGGALGFAASYLAPPQYVSTATMRITVPMLPADYSGPRMSVDEQVRLLTKRFEARTPTTPGIHIERVGASSLLISSRDRDTLTARARARSAVSWLTEENNALERSFTDPTLRRAAEYKVGANLELLDPPELPESPVSPNREVLALIGLIAGILGGLAMLRVRRDEPHPIESRP